MKNWRTKYRRKINLILFLSYSLIIFLSAFHHHNFNFSYINSLEEENNANASSFTFQNDNGIKCIVHQNYFALHSTTIATSFSEQIFETKNYKLLTLNINHSVLTDYRSINQLRAPPFFS